MLSKNIPKYRIEVRFNFKLLLRTPFTYSLGGLSKARCLGLSPACSKSTPGFGLIHEGRLLFSNAIYIMPVHLNSLGMYGQDEPKPQWVSRACSCFFIELILKYPSDPQLERKNSNAEAFLHSNAVSKRQNKYDIITICNRVAIFTKSVSAMKHVITMSYSTVIYTTEQPNVSQTSKYSPL